MATTDFVDGMNDTRLKPRMLRSILSDLLPEENRPFPTASKMSSVVSRVKIHGLLTEIHPHPPDRKMIDGWRSVVDDWVDRLLSLVSSKMPDKCWAGTCLLGVTCEECSSGRFLASYALWFQKLLPNIQPPSATHFVKVASCASLADLFTRLAEFSILKKDAASLAGKLALPVLQLLNESETEAVWEGAINLLCTLITLFPSSMYRHYDNIEAHLVSRIMSSKRNGNMSRKFANCLALLPKVRGDQDSWSLLMQKILIAINVLLKDAFSGLEEEAKMSQIARLLVPPGKDPPPPLGGQPEASGQRTANDRELLVPKVSNLMLCCCIMLTIPYPVQVIVPIHGLLSLVGRVLLMDGSLHGSVLPYTTAMHQELLCVDLPVLHLDSLDLLMAVIKGVRSQLLPHAANVVRLLEEYFSKATLPSIRIKVYSIMHTLLISMGAGMAMYLGKEVYRNASADLSVRPVSDANLVNEAPLQTPGRKRKHNSVSPMEQPPNGTDTRLQALTRQVPTSLAVKMAALKALEALIMVGGSLTLEGSEGWRSNVDYVVINVATNACNEGWGVEGKCDNLEDLPVSLADFQLTSLEALLASLLSPSPYHARPPYLSQGLELFRRGKQETGTKVAAFCAHALLALEVLIHPRALPFTDSPAGDRYSIDDVKHGHQNSSMWDDPTFINDREYDNEPMESASDGLNINKYMDDADQLPKRPIEASTGEKDIVKPVIDHSAAERSQQLIHSSDVEMECSGREEKVEERERDLAISTNADLSKVFGASPNLFPDQIPTNEMEPNKDVALSINASLMKDVTSGFESLGSSKKEKKLSYDSDSGSMDSLPSIVDADPDSDPEFD